MGKSLSLNGKGLHIAIVKQVNVGELGSADLSRVFLTGSGGEANLLDAGSTSGTMHSAKCLA